MNSNTNLKLTNLSFSYKNGIEVLQNINMDLKAGTITALVGENGCGKTTLFRILSGMTSQSSGDIFFEGNKVLNSNIINYKKNLGYMPEQLTLYPEERVDKVIEYFALLRNFKLSQEKLTSILDLVGLTEHRYKKISALSKGLKQRVNFAQSIVHNPKISIFDEPSNGFDYIGVEIYYKVINKLAQTGTIVIMTSHLFSELWGKVDKILFLKSGQIKHEIQAKFGNLNYASKKVLFLRVDDQDKDKFNKILEEKYPNIFLSDTTLKAELSISHILNILSLVEQYKIKLSDIQIDSMDIQLMLKGAI
jgi:Cu-processing system ATP-binding protein